MRKRLGEVAAQNQLDIAIQQEGLGRRAKRLVVLDVDSTLIQDEVIELLGAEAGCESRIKEITDRAMLGEIDFEQALRERVRLLKGLDADAIGRARATMRLTPGARTFVRTLKLLGYSVGIVSGGFTDFTDWLAAELDLGPCGREPTRDSRRCPHRRGARQGRGPKAQGGTAETVRRSGDGSALTDRCRG
ncbi:MAG: HAD-IB family phosphatase [Microthrixaceae bacterium]